MKERTARTGQPRQNSKDKTAGTAGKGSPDNSVRTRQKSKVRNRTGKDS
jgi:hypothetical protein